MISTPRSSDLIELLAGIVGTAQVLTDPADLAPFLTDWRGRYRGAAQCVVRPGNTAEVAAVVKACADAGVPIVPQGGNTSLCGAATPNEVGKAVVVSLSRLNRIAAVDPKNNTISVEAGCTLAAVQEAARAADRLFPLALASEGSCQIGGNLSTNAGGVQVLRYGNTRELTLGLEVVLPNGEIWNGLRGLRKDNTGYDLKQLFIGAEGTLGIITGAVLKLFPLPKTQVTCWLNVASPAAAVDLLNSAKSVFDSQLTAFELVSETSLGLVLKNIPDTQRPTAVSPWYVLAEFSAAEPAAIEIWLAEKLEAGEVNDGVVAQSEIQAKKLWALRENISEAQKIEGISIKHDISVPVSSIPEFLATADAALAKAFPGIRVVAFGHVGDGNLHYNLSKADAHDNAAFIASQPEVNRLVHDTVHALNGSISAEHGIGQLKRDEIRRYKSPVEMALMRSIKQALDPRGLMNPGKVI
ncbi:FAD-binding oxidoreductase [Ferribacterium limneticum]|uniref:FAD-binding oxidoreductase n=1 Tax=Ferribacterium limneticum TaxID=76259 RepID=UPI001CF9CDEF|nr:FAD-binding oxidoreductase [Ferribacterium limneticum]UCV29893.1 FAD-binding oxidoreductase [Ferribacterium limneticum]UCV33812.1 FAD-binding oxidoreductase [Ferribacterium limneticum]